MSSAISFYEPRGPYWWLANFAPIPVNWDGSSWRTVEHAFQAAKFWPNKTIMRRIGATRLPGQAKSLAGSLRNKRRRDWYEMRLSVMRSITLSKYLQNPRARSALLLTGYAHIIEDARADDFWGGGANLQGANMMGKIIMAVRDEIRSERPESHRQIGGGI